MELEKAADLHFGTKINKFRKVSDKENNLKRFFFCSQDGKIGEIIPLREYDQKKLLVNLQNELSEKLPFTAGLNPKEFRFHILNILFDYKEKLLFKKPKGFIVLQNRRRKIKPKGISSMEGFCLFSLVFQYQYKKNSQIILDAPENIF